MHLPSKTRAVTNIDFMAMKTNMDLDKNIIG